MMSDGSPPPSICFIRAAESYPKSQMEKEDSQLFVTFPERMYSILYYNIIYHYLCDLYQLPASQLNIWDGPMMVSWHYPITAYSSQ